MGRFFFDIVEDGSRTEDGEGLEFRDATSAMKEASRTLIGIARDVLTERRHATLTIEVRDDAGSQVFAARLCFEFLEPIVKASAGGPQG